MSDQPLSGDELASALLDGEAAGPRPVEPAIAVRVEELRVAVDAIAQPVVVDEAVRERAIGAALQAFDAPTTSERRTHFMPALAAIAAAVLVLVGVVAVLRHDGSSPAETASPTEAASGATTSASAVPDRAAANDAAGSAAGAAATIAPAPALAPSTRDLGDIEDAAALRAAIAPDRFVAEAAPPEPAATACEVEARAGAAADLGTLTVDVTLHWKGQAARALVFVDASSASRVVVVADPSCAVLDVIV